MKKLTETAKKPPKSIPKPPGTVGKGLKLRDEMRLQNNKPLYLNCLMTVRDLCLAGRLDWKKGIRQQDAGKLGALYDVARAEQPYLARFENDWATAQILIQYMSNRRKNAIRKGRVIVTEDDRGRRLLKDVRVVGKVNRERDQESEEDSTDEDDLDDGFMDEDREVVNEDEDDEEDQQDELNEDHATNEHDDPDEDGEPEQGGDEEIEWEEDEDLEDDSTARKSNAAREGTSSAGIASASVGTPAARGKRSRTSRGRSNGVRGRPAGPSQHVEISDTDSEDDGHLPPVKRRKLGQVKGVPK
ncbi:hypothetical protein C8Q78DRAFT_194550 [Trametes maxima]|nr:hypothetical protein C8Q78DRAFT_213824 [Trametes maxima]KAI0669692.1 hypothetical protein C8Q78DRAFT_194550 [Trametes maxima]